VKSSDSVKAEDSKNEEEENVYDVLPPAPPPPAPPPMAPPPFAPNAPPLPGFGREQYYFLF